MLIFVINILKVYSK